MNSTAPVSIGDRIILVKMTNDPDPVAPGTKGTVTSVGRWMGNEWNIGVDWDNGRTLGLCLPSDAFLRGKKK